MKWTANILILIYVFINLINNTMNLTTSTISLVAFIVLNYFIKTDKIKNKLTLNKLDETEELGSHPMLFEAYKFIVFTGSCDAMTLKRQLNICYNRALNIIDNLESLGIVSKINKENKRLVNIFPNTE